jgi:hypothetical protein
MLSKKETLLERLLLILKVEKQAVDGALINGDLDNLQPLQTRAFYTAKAIRKLL